MVAAERKDAPCPGGIGWGAGEVRQMLASQVKTVGRKEIGMLESWVINGSEVKSRRAAGQRTKGRGSQFQTLALTEWKRGQR